VARSTPGGLFHTVGGAVRNKLAAFDATTGALLGWNPDGDGTVHTLASDGTTIAAGGELNSVNGVDRDFFAAIDTTTGRATSFDAGLNGSVTTLVRSGTTMYVGGGFSTFEGQRRNGMAAFDNTTGQGTSWAPPLLDQVTPFAMTVDRRNVYVGGNFTTVFTSKGPASRRGLAAFTRSSGNLTSWNPSADGVVRTLTTAGALIYAGGNFQHIGLAFHNGAAAISTNGKPTSWDPRLDLPADVHALSVVDTTVYLAGDFQSASGQTRVGPAAVTSANGAVLPWAPNTSAQFGEFDALLVSGSTVYVGGSFEFIGGPPRDGLAAVDAASGALMSFTADINLGRDVGVLAIAPAGVLYPAGSFTDIAGSLHEFLAALTP
jgi:hypothetical protein